MELTFENMTEEFYAESMKKVKTMQEYMESVVPDTNEDIAHISSVRTEVYIKSKDVTSHGVTVTGEICSSVLYITESENKVQSLSLKKQFVMDTETDSGEMPESAVASVKVSNVEARILNPRKLAMTVELTGEITAFRKNAEITECLYSAKNEPMMHTLEKKLDAVGISLVTDKTFTVTDQFAVMQGKAVPARVVSSHADFICEEGQLVGGKALLKGKARIELCYLSEEANYPIWLAHTVPFSQLVDVGENAADGFIFSVETVSAYTDVTDAINGGKSIDAEIHAVLQLIGYKKMSVCYVADMYSNLAPVTFEREEKCFCTAVEQSIMTASCIGELDIGEDCRDVLSISAAITHSEKAGQTLRACVQTDAVYSLTDGTLAAVRRMLTAELDCGADVKLESAVILSSSLRPEGEMIRGDITVGFVTRTASQASCEMIVKAEYDEENLFDYRCFPAATVVRAENETLWELAAKYHSSTEKIETFNDCADIKGKLVLIPKTV